MSKQAKISTVIRIDIPSGHTIMAVKQADVRKKAEAYLTELLAGIGIPDAPVVHWEKQPAAAFFVRAFINEKPVRLRHTTANSLGAKPADFIQALCEDILRNRSLFITPGLIAHIAERAHTTFQRFEEKEKERVVSILLKQGFGLQRLLQFVPAADSPDNNTPETWAEACIGDLESTRFVMHAHPNQIDPDDNPLDFNRLIESADYFVEAAFKIKGIPYPKMRSEKHDHFAPDEMAFQINDLLFPARPMGEMSKANLHFANFLVGNSGFFLNRGSVNFLLDSLESANPNLLALTRSRFTTDFIAAILRNLAADNISIRPLVRILEILVCGGQDVYRQQPNVSEAPPLSETIHLVATDKRPDQLELTDWSELVRFNLKNAIINRALPHFDEPQTLSCFYLENTLFEKITRFNTLRPEEQSALRETLHRQIAGNYLTPAGKIRPVITSAAWRKKISDLIAFEFPETPVFSLQECLPRIIARFDQMISA